MSQDHECAPFLRTIGRGPRLSRRLDRAEARAALRLVLEGRVDPAQFGAFLRVLRYRGETPEELAGMIEAARETFSDASTGASTGGTPAGTPAGPVADLDWPALLPGAAHMWREAPLDPGRVAALWRGEIDLPAPAAAVTGIRGARALSPRAGRGQDRAAGHGRGHVACPAQGRPVAQESLMMRGDLRFRPRITGKWGRSPIEPSFHHHPRRNRL